MLILMIAFSLDPDRNTNPTITQLHMLPSLLVAGQEIMRSAQCRCRIQERFPCSSSAVFGTRFRDRFPSQIPEFCIPTPLSVPHSESYLRISGSPLGLGDDFAKFALQEYVLSTACGILHM